VTVGRRRLLGAGLGALGVPVAGCTDDSDPDPSGADGGDSTEATPEETSTGETAAPSERGSPTDAGDEPTPTDELDLSEANVVGVEADGSDGEVRFSVTLIHDDEGEAGYANWWQVETLEGDRLGRRDLAHPHGTQEFTRSETVSVPSGVDCVVVRAHDQTHGYGGQSMLFDPGSGATRAARQGSDPSSFDPGDCPE
jgi:hypothetical protein